MIITPSNELDAVNEILSSVGSSPVNSLEDDLNVDVLNAKRILSAVSTEVQSRGYRFNTLNNVYLTPDSDTGLVPFAHDYIRVFSSGYKLVNRSGYFSTLRRIPMSSLKVLLLRNLLRSFHSKSFLWSSVSTSL